MHGWNNEELRRIADADDLHVSPLREGGATYGTPTWIWSVAVAGALYVRGYNGQDSRWYRAAARQIVAAGRTKEVAFEPVDGPVLDAIDEAYRAKYREPLSRTDDRRARPVRDRPDHAAGRGSMNMKQLLVYGASLLAVAAGGAAVTQEADGRYIQVAEFEVDAAQVDAYRAAIEDLATARPHGKARAKAVLKLAFHMLSNEATGGTRRIP